jgi:transcriptional regulator with XRE-family HTH domain
LTGSIALLRMRHELGWTQERMAAHYGVSVKTYRRRETARKVDPVFDGFVALLAARKEAA